jgi:hypothetical protein
VCHAQGSCIALDDKEADNLRFISEIPQRDNLVPVGDHNFGKLVLAKHRPYHTVVLFTTANRGGECSACEYVVLLLLQHWHRVCGCVVFELGLPRATARLQVAKARVLQ